jgi:two-component system KDP operon response regulator KdpE
MAASTHILVIDDEPQILRALKTILTERHFQVTTASRGEEGLALAAANPPDDHPRSEPAGHGWISSLRTIARMDRVPIIVLSVRDSERDKVMALDKGADDYLTKPFGIEELQARIRVALRHAAQVQAQSKSMVIHAGGLEINLAEHTVKRGGEEIKLTATEFKLLAYLAAHADRVLTHQAILSHVWDPADADHVEYLRVYMRQLRKKLEDDPDQPQFLITEPGVGYRLLADE